jgi:hypothetical protein
VKYDNQCPTLKHVLIVEGCVVGRWDALEKLVQKAYQWGIDFRVLESETRDDEKIIGSFFVDWYAPGVKEETPCE